MDLANIRSCSQYSCMLIYLFKLAHAWLVVLCSILLVACMKQTPAKFFANVKVAGKCSLTNEEGSQIARKFSCILIVLLTVFKLSLALRAWDTHRDRNNFSDEDEIKGKAIKSAT